jgi:predicted acyltransferase
MVGSEELSTATLAGSGEASAAVSLPAPSVLSKERLRSLDALRGFAMFWLIGGRELTLATVTLLHPAWTDWLDTQLTHPKWRGFVAWDMVMPVFLFLVGTSMPFSLAKRCELGLPLWSTYWRVARRVAVLWLLGTIAQYVKYNAEGMELYSNALHAIAVGYLLTSLALLYLRAKGQIILFVGLVLGYGALLMFVPFGDHPGGTLERTANLPRYIDEIVLGDFRHAHSFTWVLTSLGFSATVLLGAVAGHLLRIQVPPRGKLFWLAITGLACMAVGWGWSCWLPLNRHLWTSSMILWAGGVSFLLVALFYAVIDVVGFYRWAFPFVVIGANAILAYMLDPFFDMVGNRTVLACIPSCPAPYLDLLSSVGELTLLWLLLWYLYRKRLFFRA